MTAPPRLPAPPPPPAAPGRPQVLVVPWSVVAGKLGESWGPQAPHVSVWGQTRVAGKSHLARFGLTPLLTSDRVLLIDNKGGDPTWRGWGRDISRLRRAALRGREDPNKARSGWYRLIVPRDRVKGRAAAREAIERVYNEGEWVVILDEGRAVTDPQYPNLGMRPAIDELFLRGGSRGIMVVHGSQAPRWCTSSAYSECAHSFIGRTVDAAVQQRLRETSGYTKDLDPVIAGLRRHTFLYLGEGGDALYITQAPPS